MSRDDFVQGKFWAARKAKMREFLNLVENGEFECEQNPTASVKNPPPEGLRPELKCTNTATHVKTVRRVMMGEFVYYIALCEEHRGFFW